MGETCNIQFWKQHRSGGHFIAWERPEVLVADVAEFFDKEGPVFKNGGSHGGGNMTVSIEQAGGHNTRADDGIR